MSHTNLLYHIIYATKRARAANYQDVAPSLARVSRRYSVGPRRAAFLQTSASLSALTVSFTHMSLWRALFSCLLIASILVSTTALGQTPAKKPENKSAARTDLQQTRLFNILQVKKFAERALSFQELRTEVVTVSRLADLLWTDDEVYARQLFSKALDACSVAEATASNSDGKITKRGITSIRRQVIGYISRHDAKWAQRLIDSDLFSAANGYSPSQANVETAYDLARNNDNSRAVDFAERSLNGGVSPWIVGVLVELRRTDQKSADSLFLTVLNEVARQSVDLNTFLYLGTYLFTSPKVNPDSPTAVSQVVVGNVLVYDITLDRPNISPALVRAYLGTGVNLLGRSNSADSEGQPSLSYVTAYLLLSKAQRLAPDLVPPLMTAMEALAPKVPPNLVDGSAYKSLAANPSETTDETLSAIEKLSDEGRRDEKYLSLVASLWQKKQYGTARLVTKKISDPNIVTRLAVVIDFGEAADDLSKNDRLAAQRIVGTMPKGIERGLLWLAIADARFHAKETDQSAAAVAAAVESIKALTDARRGNILLQCAGLMARLNTGTAITVLNEAIKEFNNQEPGDLAKIQWRQSIEVGKVTRVFSLNIKGVDNDYSRAMSGLASLDTTSLISELDTVNEEQSRAQLMLALASALMTQPHF